MHQENIPTKRKGIEFTPILSEDRVKKLQQEGDCFNDVTVKAFDRQYSLNKTLLALHSDFFYTLFQSKLYKPADNIVDLGSDLPFNFEAWETLLDICRQRVTLEDLKRNLDLRQVLQVVKCVRYLQISYSVEEMLLECLQDLYSKAYQELEIGPDLLLESCNLFEKDMIAISQRPVHPALNTLILIITNMGYYVRADFTAFPPDLLEFLLDEPGFIVPDFIKYYQIFEQATRPRGTDEDAKLAEIRKWFFDRIPFDTIDEELYDEVYDEFSTLPDSKQLQKLFFKAVDQTKVQNKRWEDTLHFMVGTPIKFDDSRNEISLLLRGQPVVFKRIKRNTWQVSRHHEASWSLLLSTLKNEEECTFFHKGYSNVFEPAEKSYILFA